MLLKRCFSLLNRRIVTPRFICHSCAARTATWEPWEDDLIRSYVQCNGPRWTDLVQHALPHRTVVQCQQRWRDNLDPNLKHGPLSETEQELLRKGVNEFGLGQWKQIAAKYLPNRSPRRLANAWTTAASTSLPWTPEDDALLIKAYEEFGNQWTKIAQTYFPGRSRHAVRFRYKERLDPSVNHGPWSQHELDLLLRRTLLYGTHNQWDKIAQGIPGRTAYQCSQKYLNTLAPLISSSSTTQGEEEEEGTKTTAWSPWETKLFWQLARAHDCNWVKVSSALSTGRNQAMCRYKFHKDLKTLFLTHRDQVQQRPDENKKEWKSRVAHLMCEWIENKGSVMLDARGATVVRDTNAWTQQEIDLLLHERNENGASWQAIANKLGGTRTRNQCRLKYEELARQSNNNIAVGHWTEEEDEQLCSLVEKHGTRWSIISLHHPRTATQCSYRWHRVLKHQRSNQKTIGQRLTKSEQQLIAEGVQMFGHNWVAIAETYVPHRTPEQCMRWWWSHHDRNKDAWSTAEDQTLREAVVEKQEQDWDKIAQLLPGRSASECRHRWMRVLNPELKKGRWSSDEELKLLDIIHKWEGQAIPWDLVAKELDTGRHKWSCQQKYMVILRNSRKRKADFV